MANISGKIEGIVSLNWDENLSDLNRTNTITLYATSTIDNSLLQTTIDIIQYAKDTGGSNPEEEVSTGDFVVVDMYSYGKYNTSIREDGRIQITSSHPYDEQEYHYVVGNKIYRDGKYIETFKEDKGHFIDGLDERILRLIELDRPLKSKMCYN